MSIPNRILRGLVVACWLALGVSLLGCKVPSTSVSPASAEEKSVKPGINTDYLNPDLDPTRFVERFEREGREIFDHRHEIVAAARPRRGMVVGDIGAGTGLFSFLFADAVGPNGRVFAVEISQAFVDHINRRGRAAGAGNVQARRCTERSVELAPNSIDLAFLCDVYHHFEYPQSSLASIHRALRTGGELMLVEFKRVPGQSSEWILNHVRAGQETFTKEIEAAGFKQVEEVPLLKENYVVRFKKTKPRR